MNKIFYVIVFALLLSSCTNYINEEELIKPVEKSQKIASFPVVGKLKRFCIKNGYMFIKDTKDIYCYDFKLFKLIKRLVKHGEGPGEFTRVPWIIVLKDSYILESFDKIVYLNKSFEYVKGSKLSWFSNARDIESFGNNFVTGKTTIAGGKGFKKIYNHTYSLKDKELKKIKTITSIKSNSNDNYFPNTLSAFRVVFGDKLFIANRTKGFHFDVFNKDGNYIYSIDKNIRKVKTKKKTYFKTGKDTFV